MNEDLLLFIFQIIIYFYYTCLISEVVGVIRFKYFFFNEISFILRLCKNICCLFFFVWAILYINNIYINNTCIAEINEIIYPHVLFLTISAILCHYNTIRIILINNYCTFWFRLRSLIYLNYFWSRISCRYILQISFSLR